MTIVIGVVRLALAIMWVVSAVSKLRDRDGFSQAVRDFGVPAGLTSAVVVGVPIAELVCAVLLFCPDPWAIVGAVASLLLLASFTIALIVNLRRDNRPDCHCFGELGGGGISWTTVARNGVLIVLAAFMLAGAGDRPSLPGILADLSVSGRWVFVAGILVVAALLTMALALWTLMGRYGDTLVRLETLERRLGLAPQPVVPSFALPDLNGRTVDLDDVLANGRPALVAFTSPTCTHCAELLPELSAWQSDPDHPVSVVVLSTGTAEANHQKLDGLPLEVLLRGSDVSMDDYEVQGTPAAVLVGTDRTRLADVAHAPSGVRALHDWYVQAHTPAAEEPTYPSRKGEDLPALTTLSDQNDEPLALSDLPDNEVLVFWRVDCGFCEQILPEVRDLQDKSPIRLVTMSDQEALRQTGLTAALVRDPNADLNGWLGIPGTPSAVQVRNGKIDSDLAVGGPSVLELLRSAMASNRAIGPDVDHV